MKELKFLCLTLACSLLFQTLAIAQIVGPEVNQANAPFRINQILTDQQHKISLKSEQTSELNTAIAMADFDNDGINDFVKSSLNPQKIGLWLFLSSKKETQFLRTKSALYLRNLVAADVNNDGAVDLVYPCRYEVCVRIGNNDGTFQKSIISGHASPMTQNLLTHDLNKDGNLDIIMIINSRNHEHAASKIVIEYGDGQGAFKEQQQVQIATNISTAALFDDENGVSLAVGGSKGHHSGASGLFVAKLENGFLQNLTQVDSSVPSALAKNSGQIGLYGVSAESLFYYANGQMVSQKLPLFKEFSSRVDVAIDSWSKDKKMQLVLLEVSSKSTLRFFEVIK